MIQCVPYSDTMLIRMCNTLLSAETARCLTNLRHFKDSTMNWLGNRFVEITSGRKNNKGYNRKPSSFNTLPFFLLFPPMTKY